MRYSLLFTPRLIAAGVMLAVAWNISALTLEQARTMAREHYPLVKDYNLIALTEQYTVENASKAWLPQVAASLQGYWQSAVASYPEALTQMLEQNGLTVRGLGKWQYKAGVDISQTIWDGGRIRASQELARAQAAESLASDDVELYQVESRVDDLFFGILLLEQQQQAITASLHLLEANFAQVNTLLANGAAMQSDADAIEAELVATQQQQESVEVTTVAYRTILALYTNAPADVALEAPSFEGDTPLTTDFTHRPEWRLFNARSRSIDAQLKQLRASTMPTLGAWAQGGWGYPGLNFMEAMMSRSPKWSATIGLTLSWDIASLYTRSGRRKNLEAARQRIDVGRDVFSFNSDLQATNQRHEIERLRRISASDSRIVELRQRVREASEVKLREGIINPTDLLLRITDEKNARISANSHHIELLRAIAALRLLYNQ